MKRAVAAAILGSLVLLGGCGDQLPTDIPDVEGYDGLVALGWEAYADHNFQTALNYFMDAISADPSRPQAYLGAGWSSLYLPDYWRIADDYFYMAAQQEVGIYPLGLYSGEFQLQDTMWTVFECLHPDLPPSVLDPILEQTATQGLIWVGEQIHAIIGDDPIHYRFQPKNGPALAMLEADNAYTTLVAEVDSVSGGWVYLTMPLGVMEIGADDYYVWIGADDQINYEYRIFQAGTTGSQLLYDALAGSCALQDVRGESGDPLLSGASALAMGEMTGSYSFGSGMTYAGLENVNLLKVQGTAAAVNFAWQFFRFSWFNCLSGGMGAGLDPTSPTFVTDLMAVIETMLSG